MTLLTTHVEREQYRKYITDTIHMRPIAYRDGGDLRSMVQDWEDSGDGQRPHLVSKTPLMISAGNTANLRLHPTRDAQVYVEIGDPVYRMAGNLRTFEFDNVVRNGNRIRWDKAAASLVYEHGGHFGKLGLVFHTTAYRGVDNREIAFPLIYSGLTRQGGRLRIGGQDVMRLRPFVAYDLDDDLNRVSVPHEFRTVQGTEYVVLTLPVEMDAMSRPVLDPTLELQPDGTDGKDAYISKQYYPNNNFGVSQSLFLGDPSPSDNTIRTLIEFDLSSLPDTATISSCTFSLYAYSEDSANTRTYAVYRMIQSWVEGTGDGIGHGPAAGCSWQVYDGTNTWTADGGFDAADCEQTDIGNISIAHDASIDEWKNWSLTPTTKTGLDLGQGWMIKCIGESNDQWGFRSSDYTTAADRPKLSITYTEAADESKFYAQLLRRR